MDLLLRLIVLSFFIIFLGWFNHRFKISALASLFYFSFITATFFLDAFIYSEFNLKPVNYLYVMVCGLTTSFIYVLFLWCKKIWSH